MDSDRRQLAAVKQRIKDLADRKTELTKLERKRTITDEEKIDLDGIDLRLADALAIANRYDSYIKRAMKDEPQVSKSFSEADEDWTQSVTGVNTAYQTKKNNEGACSCPSPRKYLLQYSWSHNPNHNRKVCRYQIQTA